MRFSTVVAVSAAALASSAAALPTPAGAATPSTSSKPAAPSTPNSAVKSTQQHKKLTDAQRGELDLSTARTEYTKGQKELKQAQSDLASARKLKHQAIGELGLGNLDSGLRSPSAHKRPVHKTHSNKLTGVQRGEADLSTARTDYAKAQKEFKQAQGDLAASRKMEKQALNEYGLGKLDAGLKARDLDAEDILDSLAARGFFDEDEELFGRAPGSHSTSTSGTRTTSAQPKKLTGAQDLSIARTDYNKAQKELKEYKSDMAASRKMEKQGLSAYGLGGLKGRDLDVEDILDSLAARGFFDEDDELFGRAPGSHSASTSAPVHSTARTPTSGTRTTSAQPKKLTGAQDLSIARADYNKAQKEYKAYQTDMAASRKMEKQGLSAYGLGGLKARDLENVEELMEIIARGYYGANDEY